jgi:hypothetical protein
LCVHLLREIGGQNEVIGSVGGVLWDVLCSRETACEWLVILPTAYLHPGNQRRKAVSIYRNNSSLFLSISLNISFL